ncbi:Predicted DNA-binding transcriptional regulator YafY, contains an HTH and WYL domains [Lentzea albidocapillata subsp. violacea]|uniref:Predicted DNA-binding transcriptional regulator YafY, contains an HTH and WYL domains n=1 Tax=Lentzea albidocapillata subsp. violacea TaxID=128104 RepID=A0A1G8Z0C4_9PSEU|nr:WYL domain-containing protein [Lentzea albidocapillata]SDK08094.1 Predicted DNA-binding transcriptional regulator YafY, contains an HTH and WYL domains [Lentzea albidocapillata subsp. violacea]
MASARLLKLLGLLQSRREWSGAELADRLGVTTRTVRRDVDRLRSLDYPVHASMGTSGGGYRLGPGARLPPLLLDDDEAVAVAVGLRTASGIENIGETAVRALLKVEQVLPSALRHRVAALEIATVPHTSAPPAVDAGLLTLVGTACRDRQRIRFGYAGHSGEESQREAEPHRLVTWGRRWYLVAWDLLREDWRTFRLDRMSVRTPFGARFTPREIPGGDAGAFVAARVADRWPVQGVVRLSVPAPEAVEWRSYGEVSAVDETSCHVRVGGETMDDVVFMLASITVEFEVVSPPELSAALLRAADRFRRAAKF